MSFKHKSYIAPAEDVEAADAGEAPTLGKQDNGPPLPPSPYAISVEALKAMNNVRGARA